MHRSTISMCQQGPASSRHMLPTCRYVWLRAIPRTSRARSDKVWHRKQFPAREGSQRFALAPWSSPITDKLASIAILTHPGRYAQSTALPQAKYYAYCARWHRLLILDAIERNRKTLENNRKIRKIRKVKHERYRVYSLFRKPTNATCR